MNLEIEKIVNYLNKYKNDLPNLYQWNAEINKLIALEILSESQVSEINALKFFDKELKLKKIVGKKLLEARLNNVTLFNQLCIWIVKDWGGIKTAKDIETIKIVEAFLSEKKPNFKRIASASKVGAYMYPDKNVIYDARVAYALNWIILSENAGNIFFPVPEGRNSKMSAFDVSVLIRLKNMAHYKPKDIHHLDHKQYINSVDKKLFIDKKEAYYELNNLIKEINIRLWKGDEEKVQNLYYTEMLLFAIADREVLMEITNSFSMN
jgi:hypothetical protein